MVAFTVDVFRMVSLEPWIQDTVYTGIQTTYMVRGTQGHS